jgi:hypothetical protein
MSDKENLRMMIKTNIINGFCEYDYEDAIEHNSPITDGFQSYEEFVAFQRKSVDSLSDAQLYEMKIIVTLIHDLKMEVCDKEHMMPFDASCIVFSNTTKNMVILNER